LHGDVDVRKLLLNLARSSTTKEVRLHAVYALGAIGFVRDPSAPSPFGAQKAWILKEFNKVATYFRQLAYQDGLAVISIAQKWMNGEALTPQELKLVREIEEVKPIEIDQAEKEIEPRKEILSKLDPLTVEILLPKGNSTLTVIVRNSRGDSKGYIPNISQKFITSLADQATSLVAQANSRGPYRGMTPASVSTDRRIAETITSLGQTMFEHLFPPECQQLLMDAQEGTPLHLKIDPPALRIPWELAHDGTTFLCNKFDLGRVLADSHSPATPTERPLRMLLIADPSGTLPSVEKEKAQLLEGTPSDGIEVTVLEKGVDEVKCLMKLTTGGFDIVHFAGHSVFDEDDVANTGWILELGSKPNAPHVVLLAERFRQVRRQPPRLVFSNSCKGGAERGAAAIGAYVYESDVSGIGKAFISAGTTAYVGSMFNIHDERSAEFAVQFYKTLFAGHPIGHALRLTRQWALDKWGISDIIWASYILLGDPHLRLV
jgi:CHAT domain-containing protein